MIPREVKVEGSKTYDDRRPITADSFCLRLNIKTAGPIDGVYHGRCRRITERWRPGPPTRDFRLSPKCLPVTLVPQRSDP